MRIRWLRGALINLDQAVRYIARDNPKAAEPVAIRIRETVSSLEQFPHLGRAGRIKGTRELSVSGLPYIIRYQVSDETVDILRIHHAAQLWPEERK